MLSAESNAPIRGRLVAAGRIALNSWFEGDILCARLEIGPDGYVLGTVIARELVTRGQIVGRVHATKIHLLPGAFVEGEIHHTTLKLEPGATLSGHSIHFPVLQYPQELLALEAEVQPRPAGPAWPSRSPVRRIDRLPVPGPLQVDLTRAPTG